MAVPRSRGRLDRHVEFLGHLHLLWGIFNGIAALGVVGYAAAAGVLAGAARQSQPGTEIAAIVTTAVLLGLALVAATWAGIHWWCGRALLRHDRHGRLLALVLAVGNSFLVPLGTAFAGYALWVLLQEDGRRAFER